MKKLSVLSLLMCVGSLTLAGCNNGSGGGGKKTTTGGATTSDSGSTGGTSATSGTSGTSGTSTSGQPGPIYPTDWSDEQKAAMSEKLDNLILPYIPANWSVWSTTAYTFGVRTENLTAAEVKAVYDTAQGYSYLGKDSDNREWFNVETTNGLVELCVFQQSATQVAIGCDYFKGTSGAWDAADVTAMESALYGVALPHPSGVWYGPTIGNYVTSFTNTEMTIASVAQSFEDAGFLTTTDPAAETPGDMIFSKLAPNQYQGQNVYVVGYIYASEDYPVRIQAGANLSPFVTDEYTLSGNGTYFHQNDQVTLSLVKGNYFVDADEITIAPENAATLVSSTGNTFVFNVDIESGEVTFTASNRGRHSSVTIQVLDPGVPTDWTDEIKNAMDSKISEHRLPFAPGAWALVEQESFKIKSEKASASIDNIVAVLGSAGYSDSEEAGVHTLTYDDLYGLLTVTVSSDEEFVYIEASYAVHAWTAADIAEMEETLWGLTLPHPLGAWSAVTYSSTNYTDSTTCSDPRVTTEMIIQAFVAEGWLVMPYPDAGAGIYAFTKNTGQLYSGQPIYANGLFGKIGSNLIIQAGVSLSPQVDDTFTIEANSATINQGSDVTITVTVGNYYGEEAVVTASPEDAVELKSSESGVYVYTATGAADTVVTFTAELENAGLQRDVSVTIVDPSVKTAWTDEEVAAMAELYGEAYTLPFFGDGWSLSYSDGTITASAEVTGVVDSVKEQITNSDPSIFASGSSLVLPISEGVFVFLVIENESSTSVYSYFNENATAWDATDLEVFSTYLGVESLPFVNSVHSPATWNEEGGFVYATLLNVSALNYALACKSAGFSVSYGDSSKTWFIAYTVTDTTKLNIQINPTANGGAIFYAYVEEYTPAESFPGDQVLSWLKTALGDDAYEATIIPLEAEGVSYAVYSSNDEIRVRMVYSEAPADIASVISAYNASCAAEGYVQYSSSIYDSPDGKFYYSIRAVAENIIELVFILN